MYGQTPLCPPGRLVLWESDSSMFEMGFYRMIFDSVERRSLTLYLLGLLIVLDKAEYSLT